MADSWFVERDGQRFGPYTSARLKSMTATGQVLPVDLVARGETGKWVSASQVKGLFDAASVRSMPAIPGPPPLAPGSLPKSVTTLPFDFGNGPPPLPDSASNGPPSVGGVTRRAITSNPVAMALLSGPLPIPVGHILAGQVLKAVAVMFAALFLMVSLGCATDGMGLPFALLAYAAVIGADAYLLALMRSAGEPVGPWDTPVVGKLLGVKGLLPTRIALPVLGMLAVLGSTLLLGLFGVKEMISNVRDLRFQFLTAFALFHSGSGIAACVLTVRLRHYIAAPVAAILTATVFGWYAFALGMPVVWILGLTTGIALGAWALFTFRSPEVKAMFADGGGPGPLDRFGMPVIAGATGGLLAAILCVGGVLYSVARDETISNRADSGGGGSAGGWLSSSQRDNSEYKRGYKIGSDMGERILAAEGKLLEDHRPAFRASAMKHLNKPNRDNEKDYRDLLRVHGPDHDGTLLYRGIHDGYAQVVAKAGVTLD